VFAVANTIWNYDTWRERTKHATPPFSPAATPENTSLNANELDAIRALAERIHSIDDYGKRVMNFQASRSNDQAGKDAWIKWFKIKHRGWKLQKDIEIALSSHGRHPRQMVSRRLTVSM
jgi:hypothetical protein